MKFKFDHTQDFQLDAINAIADIFTGQPREEDLQFSLSGAVKGGLGKMTQTELGFGNQLTLDDDAIFQNVLDIQRRNGLKRTDKPRQHGKNFTIEMETGTGKTYVYLRTMFELNQRYGFKKFIVVVPSVAIREGVEASVKMMKEDFLNLYNQPPFRHFIYDSARLSDLRSFATGNDLQLMIINIQAFDKAKNVIYQNNDRLSGRQPIEFIQSTRPILILDEPQSVEGEGIKRQEAIFAMNPLCTLRYSATHRELYNLMFTLDPVQAYQRRLVKRILVSSVTSDNDRSQAWLKVEDIKNDKGKIQCRLSFLHKGKNGVSIKSRLFKQHDDLWRKSDEYGVYSNGWRITEINSRPGMEYVRFSNGLRFAIGQENGGNREEVVKAQIRATIKAHFEKELQVAQRGIKVLSLFFIDKVENYRVHSDEQTRPGIYAQWFEEIYTEAAKEYQTLFTKPILPACTVHDGYFSKDKKGNLKDTTGSTQADEDTYSLIMRDKEKLLGLDNSLKFIWSHSALREGWDNPNVFQICTLNETKSAMKKRQEIGRGLRLPRNQDGDIVRDELVNQLVVVANESYDSFARSLQSEYETDCGIIFGRLPLDAFEGMAYIKDGKERKISKEQSGAIWDHMLLSGYIADTGFIKDAFTDAVKNLTFTVPKEFREITRAVAGKVDSFRIENIIRKHEPTRGKLRREILDNSLFQEFWNQINIRTLYSVEYDTEKLIESAASAVRKMPAIEAPAIRNELAGLEITSKGVEGKKVSDGDKTYAPPAKKVPDILGYIQAETELTRHTIFKILKESGRLKDYPVNPQKFLESVVNCVRFELNKVVLDGLMYEKQDAAPNYEVRLFEKDEHPLFYNKERLVPTEKSVYDYIQCDSDVEVNFAQRLERDPKISYYLKLPNWFLIDTPVGKYNPDWAILKKNGEIVYLIRETKSTKDQLKLRLGEHYKIECGRKHFAAIGVDYDVSVEVGG